MVDGNLLITLIWVFLGAFLGFGSAYALQRLVEKRQRKRLCTVAREIIGLEIINNLRIIESIEEGTLATIEGILSYQATLSPRADVFRQLLDLPSLSVLDDVEQRLFAETFSQLNSVSREFTLWPGKIQQAPYIAEYKKAASQTLLNGIRTLKMNLVQLLCEICLRQGDGLQEKQLKAVYYKLQRFKNESEFKLHLRAGKSSDYKMAKQAHKGEYKYLVVWEHDWPECPLEVIELRPSSEGDNP